MGHAKVSVIPVVAGALGAIPARFKRFVKDVGINLSIEYAQKTALLGTYQEYQDRKKEIKKLWNLKSVDFIPVVVGALGAVNRKVGLCLEQVLQLDLMT